MTICRKKYKPSPKKWILASRRTGFRRNPALIPANAGLFHYAANNPVRYIDPMGMWIDNHDGTYTAESGNTLYDLYGDEWKEKSGFTRDPRTLQIGEIVGKKNIITQNNFGVKVDGKSKWENTQNKNYTSISLNYYFSRSSYVPVEGIGVNGGAGFTGTAFLGSNNLSIFASGFLVAQNLVDNHIFIGDATLFVNGNKVGKSYFQYPNYSFICIGPPFTTIGDANFDYDFSNAQSVEVDLHFRAGIAVDGGRNRHYINYSKYRIKIK